MYEVIPTTDFIRVPQVPGGPSLWIQNVNNFGNKSVKLTVLDDLVLKLWAEIFLKKWASSAGQFSMLSSINSKLN